MFTDQLAMFLCPNLLSMSVSKATLRLPMNDGFIYKTFRFSKPIQKLKTWQR